MSDHADGHSAAPDTPAGVPPEAPRRASRSNRTWVMGVLALGVAGIALVVLEPDGRGPAPVNAVGEPDFYMEGVVVHQYRPDGSLEYRLTADEVRHFDRRAETSLGAPDLTLHHPDQAPWRIRARSGVLRRPPDGAPEETVSLRRDVVLEQTRPDGEFVSLTTSALDVYPARQYAETDQDVMIDTLVGRTMAHGLKGDLQLGMLTFNSSAQDQVRTVLQPEQFK